MFLLFSIFQIVINLLNSVFNSIVNPCGFDIRFLKNTLLLVTILYTCRLFYANKRLNLIESFWHGPCASLNACSDDHLFCYVIIIVISLWLFWCMVKLLIYFISYLLDRNLLVTLYFSFYYFLYLEGLMCFMQVVREK